MSTPDPTAPASAAATDGSAVAGFERSLDELESLVQRLEKGDLSLDESLQDPEDPASAQPFTPDAP
jgi:exodeoxyribonuclease VII small subunit